MFDPKTFDVDQAFDSSHHQVCKIHLRSFFRKEFELNFLFLKESHKKSSQTNKSLKGGDTRLSESGNSLSSSNEQQKKSASNNSANNTDITIPMGQKPPPLGDSNNLSENTEKSAFVNTVSSNESLNVREKT